MLELLAYTVLLLVLMPALLYGLGKLIVAYNDKLSLPGREVSKRGVAGRGVPETTAPAPQYETLHERLTAAAKANPFLPSWKHRGN